MIKPEELLDRCRGLSKERAELHDKKCDCATVAAGTGSICRRRAELNNELTLIANVLHMSGEDIAQVLAGDDATQKNGQAADALRKRAAGLDKYRASVYDAIHIERRNNNHSEVCCRSRQRCNDMEEALLLSKEEVAAIRKDEEGKFFPKINSP